MNARAAVGALLVGLTLTVGAAFLAATGLPDWAPAIAGVAGAFFDMLALTYLIPAATAESEREVRG